MTVNRSNDTCQILIYPPEIKAKLYIHINAYCFEKYYFYLKLTFKILFSNAQEINKFNF